MAEATHVHIIRTIWQIAWSCINYTVTVEATGGIDLTQRKSHVLKSRDNNKKVGRKQKIYAGGSEKPEILLPRPNPKLDLLYPT